MGADPTQPTGPKNQQNLPQVEGGQQQEARDAVYWKHMYEQMRDLRETEAERVSERTRLRCVLVGVGVEK